MIIIAIYYGAMFPWILDIRTPIINVVPFNISQEGNTAVMTCYENSSLNVQFSWSKNGITIVDASEKRFVINELSRNDSGLYWCLTSNKLGITMSEEYILNVLC